MAFHPRVNLFAMCPHTGRTLVTPANNDDFATLMRFYRIIDAIALSLVESAVIANQLKFMQD